MNLTPLKIWLKKSDCENNVTLGQLKGSGAQLGRDRDLLEQPLRRHNAIEQLEVSPLRLATSWPRYMLVDQNGIAVGIGECQKGRFFARLIGFDEQC